MNKDSAIIKYLLLEGDDTILKPTEEYSNLLQRAGVLEQEFLDEIRENKQALKLYGLVDCASGEAAANFSDRCFCQGVRAGFKLCLDIFDILN